MSLVTSCPACGTMFRVVPDQLKISEGWVRCGHCAEVFDATAHLGEEEPPPPVATQPPVQPVASASLLVSESPAAPLPPPQPPAAPAPAATPLAMASQPAALHSEVPEPPAVAPRDDVSSFGPDSQSLEPDPRDAPFVFRRSELLEADPVPSVLPPVPPPGEGPVSTLPEEPEAGEIEDLGFVRQARRKAFWRRPFTRFVLSLLVLALAALLVLQFAWQERDRLAVLEPRLRPALQEMCVHLQCTLAPPRQIDALVIESSGFGRLRNETYRLSFALRNNAATAVATPALELTLTDGQDQPVLRRVLTPQELGAPGDLLAGGAEWSGSVGIVVAGAGGPRVAGYRLLAFYP